MEKAAKAGVIKGKDYEELLMSALEHGVLSKQEVEDLLKNYGPLMRKLSVGLYMGVRPR